MTLDLFGQWSGNTIYNIDSDIKLPRKKIRKLIQNVAIIQRRYDYKIN